MTINKLIDKLKQVQEQHGNIRVVLEDHLEGLSECYFPTEVKTHTVLYPIRNYPGTGYVSPGVGEKVAYLE